MDTKRCAKCREVKPVDEFHRSTDGKGGRQAYCKECRREAKMASYTGMRKGSTPIPLGTRSGRLVTVSAVYPVVNEKTGRIKSVVDVLCECGIRKTLRAYAVSSGRTRSCGCFQRDVARAKRLLHGHSATASHSKNRNHRVYRIWKAMRSRCMTPNFPAYRWYGAKGIRVSPLWDNYVDFVDWAVNSGYQDGLELDRIDTSKDYCPDNCRWITKKENIRRKDRLWSDEVETSLMRLSAQTGESAYEIIRIAVEKYLAENF